MLFSNKLLPFALTLLSAVNAAPLRNLVKRELVTRVFTADPTTVTDFYSTTTHIVVAPTVEYIVKDGVTYTTTLVPENVDVTAEPVTTTFTVNDDDNDDKTTDHSSSKDISPSPTTVTLSPTEKPQGGGVITIVATESSTVATLTSVVVDMVTDTVYLDQKDDVTDNTNDNDNHHNHSNDDHNNSDNGSLQYYTSYATFVTTLNEPPTDIGVETTVTKVNTPMETEESVVLSTYVTTIAVQTKPQASSHVKPGDDESVIYSTYYSTYLITYSNGHPIESVATSTRVEVQVVDSVSYITSFSTFVSTLNPEGVSNGEAPSVQTFVSESVSLSTSYSTYVTTLELESTDTTDKTNSESQTQTQTQTESQSQTESQTHTESHTESQSQTETQTESNSTSETESQVHAQTETQTESNSSSETESQAHTQTESQTESTQTESSSTSETESQVNTQTESPSQTQSQTQSYSSDSISSFTSYPTMEATHLGSTTKTFADGSVATSVGSNPYPVEPNEGDSDQVTMKLKTVPVALTYSPYTDDFGCKSVDQMLSDLTIIKNKGVYQIRVYGTWCGTIDTILPLATKLGIKVNQGLWIGPEGTDSIDEPTEELLAYGKANGWDVFEYITIGNEAIYAGYCTPEELIDKIHSVTAQLRAAGYQGQVTTSEPPSSYISHPELCSGSVIDFVGVNAHSYFDPWSTPETAGSFMLSQVQVTRDVCGTDNIVITDTGFPYKGDTNGGNVPSRDNQVIALQNIFDVMNNQVTVLAWEDDMWKDPGPYGIEQYFGVNAILP